MSSACAIARRFCASLLVDLKTHRAGRGPRAIQALANTVQIAVFTAALRLPQELLRQRQFADHCNQILQNAGV
jgi:hypothetical protein